MGIVARFGLRQPEYCATAISAAFTRPYLLLGHRAQGCVPTASQVRRAAARTIAPPVRVLHAVDPNLDVVVVRVFCATHEPRRTHEEPAGPVVDVVDFGTDGLVVVFPLGVPLVTERIWSLLVGRAVSKCKVGRGVIGGCVVQQQFPRLRECGRRWVGRC